jgi:hypothetical protein
MVFGEDDDFVAKLGLFRTAQTEEHQLYAYIRLDYYSSANILMTGLRSVSRGIRIWVSAVVSAELRDIQVLGGGVSQSQALFHHPTT